MPDLRTARREAASRYGGRSDTLVQSAYARSDACVRPLTAPSALTQGARDAGKEEHISTETRAARDGPAPTGKGGITKGGGRSTLIRRMPMPSVCRPLHLKMIAAAARSLAPQGGDDVLENHLTARVQSTSSQWCHAKRRRHPLLEERWPIASTLGPLGGVLLAPRRPMVPVWKQECQ